MTRYDANTIPTAVLVVATILVVAALTMQPALATGVAASTGADTSAASADTPTRGPVLRQGATTHGGVHATQDDDDQVTLADSVVTEQRGDVVAMNFTFSGDAEEARVTLGDPAVGFEVNFTIRDGDGDGTVVVLWNTALSSGPAAGLAVQNDATESGGDGFSEGPTVVTGVSRPVDPAGYTISVVTVATGVETDVGRVDVEERATEGLTVHTAPANLSAFETAADVERAASGAAAGETIAVGERVQDWVVLRLAASGLEGYVDDVSDLAGGVNGVTLDVAQNESTTQPNEGPVGFRLDGNATLLADGEADVYYVVFPASELLDAGATVGDQFVANLTVGDSNNVTETNESASATFTLVEGNATFDLEDGQLVVDASESARVTGTSTWAPGTELLVHLRSANTSGNATPFTARGEAVVSEEGTWNASVDLSEQVPGQRAKALLIHVNSGVPQSSGPAELR